jgi:hypothetical protein
VSPYHQALQRAIANLVERLEVLEAKLQAGEDLWSEYRETIAALVAAMGQVSPGSNGEYLSTKQMAARLGVTPKTLQHPLQHPFCSPSVVGTL